MHHTLLTIANDRFLPVDKFTTFAKERGSEYLCDDETVGTWDVDAQILSDFVNQYHRTNGFLSTRQMALIRKKMIKYAGQLTRIANGEV